MTADLKNLTVAALLEALASAAPAPGGGAACALSGALSAALVSMVANLTLAKAAAETPDELQAALAQAEERRQRLTALMDADARAYDQVIAAYRLPRATAADKTARRAAIEAALQEATRVPLAIAADCAAALALAEPAARLGTRTAVTDAGAAAYLAEAAARAALLNVEINLGSIRDEAFAAAARARAAAISATLPAAREAALSAMYGALATPKKES